MKQLAVAIGAPRLSESSNATNRVGRKRSQRDVMRELYAQLRGDEDRIISEYAEREGRGEVQRIGKKSGLTPEQYALALLNDGLKKGWLA